MKSFNREQIIQKSLQSASIGAIRKDCYRQLCKIIGFDNWHIAPINERQYAIDLVLYLNSLYGEAGGKTRTVIEVGCGIGDIIANLLAKKKVGYDTETDILTAGRIIHPFITFKEGSFADITEKKIDCLIMINFIHNISPKDLKMAINRILKNSKVHMFVIDRIQGVEGTEYKYSHTGDTLFGPDYKCIKRSRGYEAASGARRVVEYWRSAG